MKKRKRMVAVALVIVAVVGYLWLNQITDMYKSVLKEQGYSNLKRLKAAESEGITRVYQSGDAWVQIVSVTGYSSNIVMSVEISDAQVKNVLILSEGETSDYGGYINETWFLDRLNLPIDPQPELVKMAMKSPNHVVAVTGATISSQSVVDGVNRCIENYGGTNSGN